MPRSSARKADASVREPPPGTPSRSTRRNYQEDSRTNNEPKSGVPPLQRNNKPSRRATAAAAVVAEDPKPSLTLDTETAGDRVSSGDEPLQGGDPGTDDSSIPQPITASNSMPSIWDWELPLDSWREQSSYNYELTGELIDDSTIQRRQPRHEFSVPHPIRSSTANDWFPSATTTHDLSSFAVPRRPQSTQKAGGGNNGGSSNKRKSTTELSAAGKQATQKRASRTLSEADEIMETSPMGGRPRGRSVRSQDASTSRPHSDSDNPAEVDPNRARTESVFTARGPPLVEGLGSAAEVPTRTVFPIQIGDRLFRLSGTSLSSDAPSYFTHFFQEQLRHPDSAANLKTLYIDRDAATFADIALHLQGYHIEPRDAAHFVKLYADAQYYSLPKLTAQLLASPIFIRIGNEEFRIPRDLFSNPGDTPNYFSLGFAVFFSGGSTNEPSPFSLGSGGGVGAFGEGPSLSSTNPQRPRSIIPPSIPNRSAKTFADILHLLRGYPLDIRSREHRRELLRDARYFHLKGLEQRLIPHEIAHNLARGQNEITIRLQDIRQSGISFVSDSEAKAAAAAATSSSAGAAGAARVGSTTEAPSPKTTPTAANTAVDAPAPPKALEAGWIHYQRPYVDSSPSHLILDISGEESTILTLPDLPGSATSSNARFARAVFHRQTRARITSLFSVIASKLNLPVTQPLGLRMLERERGQGIEGGSGKGGVGGEAAAGRAAGEAAAGGRRGAEGEDKAAGRSGSGAGTGGRAPSSPSPSPEKTGISEPRVKVIIGADAHVTLNGELWTIGSYVPGRRESGAGGYGEEMELDRPSNPSGPSRKRKRRGSQRRAEDDEDDEDEDSSESDEDDEDDEEDDDDEDGNDEDRDKDDEDGGSGERWIVQNAQWRLRMQPIRGTPKAGRSGIEIILAAVKIEAVSDEQARNAQKSFLG